jgi:hypothetical protein
MLDSSLNPFSVAYLTLLLQVASSTFVIGHVYLMRLQPRANIATESVLDYDKITQGEESENDD